jgi:hypothetical protein
MFAVRWTRRLPAVSASLVAALAVAFTVGSRLEARAQMSVTTVSISGTVSDATGAPIPAALVAAHLVETDQRWTLTADDAGRFRFLALPLGRYEITASSSGFEPATVAVTLGLGEAVDVPLTLLVPGVNETVEVQGASEPVEITRTQAAQNVTPAEVASLPLNGRNYLDLALLTPGVSRTNLGAVQRFAETSAVPGTGISLSSQRNLNNSFLVDGLSANDDAASLAGTFFSQEVIREFQVITNGGIAEFGRASSGVISVATQSGTNRWQARGYGFFRDDRFDAANPLTGAKDPLRQRQYGATVGGPLERDRHFLFANVERTDNERTGLITVSPEAVAAVNDTLTAVGYPGPALDTGAFHTGYTTTNVFARTDSQMGSNSRLSLRYSLYDADSPNARTVGGLNTSSRGTSLANRDQNAAMNLLTTFGRGAVNELRAQVTRSRLDAPVNDPIGPAVTINGVASFGTSTSAPTGRDLDTIEVNDAWTGQHGAHLVKAGGGLLLDRVTILFPGALEGSYTFASLPDFEAGRYTTFQQAFGDPSQFQSNPNVSAFVQDEWRARRDLTVNAGVRYDLQFLPDPIRTDTNNVSPRVGVAYAPGDRRTVLRASAGLFYDRIPLRATSNALQRDGSRYRVAVFSGAQAGAPVFPAVLPAFPPNLTISITTIDPAIQSAVSRQAGVQLEREFWRRSTVTLGYEHLSGRHLIMQRNVNAPTLAPADADAQGIPNLGRPDPRFANVGRYESIGDSRYDAFTVAARTHLTPAVDLRLSYTYSRSYDDAGNAFFSQPQDASDVRADWGPSDNDQRHRLTLSGSARTPSWRGSPMARLLADWQVSGIYSYTSPLPFTVLLGTDRNHDTNSNDRPVGVGRNSMRAFDYASLDLRLSRALPVPRGRVELLVEAFNVLDRANLLVPNNVIGTGPVPRPTFGQPTAAGDPRQVQLGCRVSF